MLPGMTDMGHTLLVLTIYVLVAARLTRLVNYDTVLDPVRLWVARRISARQNPDGGKPTPTRWATVADFMSCPWCVGFWVSLALAPAAILLLGWPWWSLATLPFAASHLVGIGDRWVADPLEIVADD
jgi:hypothetical protein